MAQNSFLFNTHFARERGKWQKRKRRISDTFQDQPTICAQMKPNVLSTQRYYIQDMKSHMFDNNNHPTSLRQDKNVAIAIINFA